METVLEATARLRKSGFVVDFAATEDGLLRCGECDEVRDPSTMVIDEVVRYEGVSNPDDEAILFALHCRDDRPGLFLSAFGPGASPADDAVLRRLPLPSCFPGTRSPHSTSTSPPTSGALAWRRPSVSGR